MGVGTTEQVFSPFASYITFLFIGSFILAQAVFVHGLDRRFAYAILAHPWVGGRPGRILFGFGAATAIAAALRGAKNPRALRDAILKDSGEMRMRADGLRQSLGLFVSPLNSSTGLGIVTISFAMAIGQFVWGAAQPLLVMRCRPGSQLA